MKKKYRLFILLAILFSCVAFSTWLLLPGIVESIKLKNLCEDKDLTNELRSEACSAYGNVDIFGIFPNNQLQKFVIGSNNDFIILKVSSPSFLQKHDSSEMILVQYKGKFIKKIGLTVTEKDFEGFPTIELSDKTSFGWSEQDGKISFHFYDPEHKDIIHMFEFEESTGKIDYKVLSVD